MRKLYLLIVILFSLTQMQAQVNFQTGSATFGLPIFTWQDNASRMSTNMALSYSSGNGLKVNDVASNVGQGWNIIAGGTITRMQVGEPDDQKPYYQGSVEVWNDTKKYPAGYLYASFDISQGVASSITKYPIFRDKNILYRQHNDVAADKELDRFSFQFNGRTGMFILDKASNTGVCLEDNRIKIWFVRNENNSSLQIRTTIIAFYIQDENGSIYKFTKYCKTKVLKTSYCNANEVGILTQPKFKNGKVYHEKGFEDATIINPYIINQWHLEEIEDGLTNRKIFYTYVIRTVDASAGTSITHYRDVGEKDYSVITHSKSITQQADLNSITWPDGHLAVCNYGTDRVDLSGTKVLSSIDITYSGRYLTRYEFNTAYFIGNRIGVPTTLYQKSIARLSLRSVHKIGVDLKDDDPPYEFDYYMGSSLPDDIVPAPFSHLKDIWGFYNGDNNRDYNYGTLSIYQNISDMSNAQLKGLCYIRNNSDNVVLNSKTGYAKNGLLKQIKYPTGGALTYEYEQNTAVITGQSGQSMVGGVHVSKTLVTDGGFSNGCGTPLVTNYHYSLDDIYSQSSLWGIEPPQNSISVQSYYSPESKYVYYKPIADVGCKYRYMYPGILTKDQAVDITGHQKFMESLATVLDVVTAASQVMDIINICVSVTTMSVVAIVLDIVAVIVNVILTCFVDPSRDATMVMFYNTNIDGGNGLPSQFKKVEIKESSGQNGRTVLEFSSNDDYPVWEQTNPTYSMKQRFAPWAYGLNKLTTVYNANNQKVSETENIYDYTYAKIGLYYYGQGHQAFEMYPNCKYRTLVNASHRSDQWIDPSSYFYPTEYTDISDNSILIDTYGMFLGRIHLQTTKEKIFKDPGSSEYLMTSTNYEYDYQYLLLTGKRITYADNSESSTYYTYNHYLNDIVHLPNSAKNYVNNNAVNEAVTEYLTVANGDIKLSRTLERRWPLPQNNISPNLIETAKFNYDANANLIGQQDEGKRKVRHIYDYNDKFVSATVVNADPINDICAYTSFETDNLGGFTMSGPVQYSTLGTVTGKQSLRLTSSRTLSANVNSGVKYRVTFFSINTIIVTGLNLIKSYTLPSGITFYEYETSPGISSISIKGASLLGFTSIDELRLYPAMARMRTVAFDPLIGKLSECDENSRITSYEYDSKGRVRYIKDENGNVLKMYEYNIAKKPACPVTYSNFAVSEIFTKSNCTGNSIGSDIVYTIPAGTFTSTFSQTAVDDMVANDLALNGQNYANTQGTCIPFWYNAALSGNFSKEDCAIGYVGSSVNYTVAANAYRSLISQADADQQAQDELESNGQAYANTAGVGTCIYNTDPVWEGTGLEQCINNQLHKQVKDMNPNSSSYGTTQYVNTQETCQSTSTSFYVKIYSNNPYSYASSWYESYGADFYIKFYSDANCTIPYNLVQPVTINYNHERVHEDPYYGQFYDVYQYSISVSSGTEISIGYLETYWWSWNGYDEEYEYNSFEIQPGIGYTVIQ